jgi:hypothetical protein
MSSLGVFHNDGVRELLETLLSPDNPPPPIDVLEGMKETLVKAGVALSPETVHVMTSQWPPYLDEAKAILLAHAAHDSKSGAYVESTPSSRVERVQPFRIRWDRVAFNIWLRNNGHIHEAPNLHQYKMVYFGFHHNDPNLQLYHEPDYPTEYHLREHINLYNRRYNELYEEYARRTIPPAPDTEWRRQIQTYRDRRAFLSAVWYAAIGLLIGGSSLVVNDDHQHHIDMARNMVFGGLLLLLVWARALPWAD